MTVYTEESRDVLRVRPSEAAATDPDIEDRIDQIASLHDLHHQPESGLIGSILGDGTGDPVQFELLALSSGKDHPVEIYYSSDGQLETLEKRLDAIYPSSFTIEQSTLDLGANLITPVAYSPLEFIEELKAGNLAYSLDELTEEVTQSTDTAFGGELESGLENDPEDGLVPLDEYHNVSSPTPSNTSTSRPATGEDDRHRSESATASTPTTSGSSADGFDTEVWVRTDDVPSDHRFLRLDDETAVKVNPSSALDDVEDRINLSRPTFTENRRVLARPSRDQVQPSAVRWRGKGDRKKDWMTTLRSDETAQADDEQGYQPKPSVIAELLTQLTETEYPVVFQVTFKRKANWKAKATARKKDLKRGEDTAVQTALSTVMGANSESDSLSTSVQKRINQIEAKNAKLTFDVNLRAVSVDATAAVQDDGDTGPSDALNNELRRLAPAFDPLDGQYYEIDGKVVKPGSKVSTETSSTPERELEYLLDRELTTSDDEESLTERVAGSSSIHAELVANPQELSDIITIPPGEEMPKEAFRGARVKHEEESPLPRPNNAILDKFSDGMAIGTPLNEDRHLLDDPIELPESVLTTHYARFATTGFGKSIATNNDILTLHERTTGPEILLDPKGDGMCERYLKAHFARYGSLDNVYYFDVPEDLPAVGFFDIRPMLARGRSREDAIQDKVDHFHEVMRMAMGDAYDNAYVAIMVLSFLIKAKFDPEYGQDAFTLEDLYSTAVEMQREERAPRVAPTRQEIGESLTRHFDNDDASFNETMTAVLNRLDKLRENTHLYRMFNHLPVWDAETQTYDSATSAFSFTEFFDENAVVLFDLGDLRPNAARAMSMVLMSSLWDDLQVRDADDDLSMVNLILEEAAPFASTDIVTEQLLAQARSFNLSLGLIMQYPGQVKAENERTYSEIQNNVHSTLYGKMANEHEISETLATQELDPVTLKTKLTSMRPGEWLADLPSPQFNTPEPSPFSVEAMPIPEGHPESENPLEHNELRKFREAHLPRCRNRVKEQYSLRRRRASESEPVESSGEPETPSDGDEIITASDAQNASETAEDSIEPTKEQAESVASTEPGSEERSDGEGASVFEAGAAKAPGGLFGDDGDGEVSEQAERDAASRGSPGEDDSFIDSGDSGGGDGLFADERSSTNEDAGEREETVSQRSKDGLDTERTAATDESIEEASADTKERTGASTTSPSAPGDGGDSEPRRDVARTESEPTAGRVFGGATGADSDDDTLAPAGDDADRGGETASGLTPNERVEDESEQPDHEEMHEQAGDSEGRILVEEPESAPAGAKRHEDLLEEQASDSEKHPEEARSGGTTDGYASVRAVYREARRINTEMSGSSRFEALMELSTDAEEAGFDVDDDTLATITDETTLDDLVDTAPPEQSEGETDGQSADETDEIGMQTRLGSAGEEPAVDLKPEGGFDLPEEPIVEPGSDEQPAHANSRPLDEFAENVKTKAGLYEQPELSTPTSDEQFEFELSAANEELLHVLLQAMNDTLSDYSLLKLESMKPLEQEIEGADVDRLEELDLIESHLVKHRFYTVLPKGRKYLDATVSSHDGAGDLGEKTPHKVGVNLLYHVLSKRSDTARVERYQTVGDHKLDAVAYNESDEIVAVGEAETPSNNHGAIITDYEKMREVDADAIWLCRNKPTAKEVVSVLEEQGLVEPEFGSREKASFPNLKEAVAERGLVGMTEIDGFKSAFRECDL